MSTVDRRLIQVGACTGCSHEMHADACERTIQTGSGKSPTTVDCPCIKRTQEAPVE